MLGDDGIINYQPTIPPCGGSDDSLLWAELICGKQLKSGYISQTGKPNDNHENTKNIRGSGWFEATEEASDKANRSPIHSLEQLSRIIPQ